jgi:hypothetical protein
MNQARAAKRWAIVFVFAMAMAWVEAATVFYLRTLVGRIEPYQPNPLPVQGLLGAIELVREAATMVMLAGVGWLAGKNWRTRLAYGAIAFGVWDIWYYIFLKQMTGWPSSWLDWDILFLIPLPWWGPVIAPLCISLLLILGGTIVSQFDAPDRPVWPGSLALSSNLAGTILSLFVFMADALAAVKRGPEAVRTVLPTQFNWPLFTLAWLLMSAPILDIARRLYRQLPNR